MLGRIEQTNQNVKVLSSVIIDVSFHFVSLGNIFFPINMSEYIFLLASETSV